MSTPLWKVILTKLIHGLICIRAMTDLDEWVIRSKTFACSQEIISIFTLNTIIIAHQYILNSSHFRINTTKCNIIINNYYCYYWL